MQTGFTLHIFNPETDLAAGTGNSSYTPPAIIRKFRNTLALLPVLFASAGDYILIPEEITDEQLSQLPLYDLLSRSDVRIVKIADARNVRPDRIRPWGWNMSLRNYLLQNKINESLIPSKDSIERLRNLSHRKLTIDFYSMWRDNFPWVCIPEHIVSPDCLSDMKENLSDVCMKAPWSSSGRGVIFTRDFPESKIREWCRGIIRSQGGVMVEPRYDRRMDFASEWVINNREVTFRGFSLFNVSERGKYKSNVIASQEKLRSMIYAETGPLDDVIEMQRSFISEVIAPVYEGPLGFDMLLTADGTVVPCVEINIRNTMGNLSIDIADRWNDLFDSGVFSPEMLIAKYNRSHDED